tara:strand:- start:1307 stop:2335 length:1029 start_codon:yes stop_codon:yes gene_type:complete
MLTEISNDLIHHFLHKCDVNEYLKSQTMKYLYDSLNNQYINSQINLKVDFNEYPQSDFIAKSLRNKLSVHQKVYTYQWQTKSKYNVKNKLHIYMKNDILPNTQLLIDAISYITSFSDKPRSITVHLCLLNDKKVLRKNSQNLTPLNINSGSNRFSHTESEICIFRREECIKVIFHEIIHGLRFSDLGDNVMITEKLCQKYDLDSKEILIDESYTEIWAKILNCYFISSLTNSHTKFQHFCTMLACEKEFALYQGNKIKGFIKKSKNKDVDKDTNVSAYYLVVAEIFSNLEEFLMNCGIDPYIKDHEGCLEYLYNLKIPEKRRVKQNDKYYNTLRMSVSELKI